MSDVFVRACGARLHVVDAAPPTDTGRLPVVLLHGAAGSVDAWQEVLPVLARTRRTIALDLPGHGGSDVADVASTGIAMFASCVAAVLADRGVERATWMGNSIGGHVALHAAVARDPRVRALVLVNATGAHSPDELDAFLRNPAAVRARAGVGVDASLLQAALPLMFSSLASAPARRFVAQAARAARDPDAPRRAHAAIQAAVSSRDASLRERLAEIRVPTLVVWGQHDRLLDPENSTRLLAIAGARLERISASGHMPHIETPAELVRAVEPFLDEVDASR